MSPLAFQKEFQSRIGDPAQIASLFDHLPDTYFFGKDEEGRFVFANPALLEALGLKAPEEILGRTDFDFFDPVLAERYREEDRLVMKTGEPLADRVWLVPNRDGTLHWYVSSKQPIFDRGGEVIGIVAVMRDFDRAGSAVGPYRRISPVLAHVQDHYRESIEVKDLAGLIGVSVSTLERTFRELFGITPLAYLTRVRLHAARRLLAETDRSINDIALDTGFYDQSHFTKKFRGHFGTTPSAYRKDRAADRSRGAGGV